MVFNEGVSFGWKLPYPEILGLISLVVVWFYWRKTRSWGLVLVLIGGVLNLTERLIKGYVFDYWRIPGTSIYNNVNDYLIFVGVVIFLWQQMRK